MAKLETPFTSLYREDGTTKTIREYLGENPRLIDTFIAGGVLGAIKSLCGEDVMKEFEGDITEKVTDMLNMPATAMYEANKSEGNTDGN